MAKKKLPKAQAQRSIRESYDLEYLLEEIVKVKQEIQDLRENNPNPERMAKGIGEKELKLSNLEGWLKIVKEDQKKMSESLRFKPSEEEVKRNYEKNNPIEARAIKIFRYTFFTVAFVLLIWLFFFLE